VSSVAWNSTLPAPTYCITNTGSGRPSSPTAVGCSASTRAAGLTWGALSSQYIGGRLAKICSVSSNVSPSCIGGLESPSSVGTTTKPSDNSDGAGAVAVANSMGNSGASGVSR
jgi:hypothetical protein